MDGAIAPLPTREKIDFFFIIANFNTIFLTNRLGKSFLLLSQLWWPFASKDDIVSNVYTDFNFSYLNVESEQIGFFHSNADLHIEGYSLNISTSKKKKLYAFCFG